MRVLKTTPAYIYVAAMTLSIMLAALFFYDSPQPPSVPALTTFLVVLLGIACSPIARELLPALPGEKLPTWRFVGQICLIQVSFIWLFFALCANLIRIQQLAHPHININFMPLATQFVNFCSSFFPWSCIALFSVIFSYFSLCRNVSSDLVPALQPVLKKYTHTKYGIVPDLWMRGAVSGHVTIALCILLLSSIDLVAQLFNLEIFEKFSFLHLFALLGMLKFFRSKRWHKILNYCLTQRVSIGAIYITMLVCIAIGVNISVMAIQFVFHPMLNLFKPLAQNFHNMLANLLLGQEWSWFILASFLGWTPLLGSTIARFSKGYRIWHMLCAAMIVPLLLFVTIQNVNQTIILDFVSFLQLHPLYALMPLTLLYYFFKDIPHLNHLFFGYTNKKSIEKYRSPKTYLQVFPALLISSIFMMVGFGYKFFIMISIYCGLIIFPISCLVFISFIIFLWQRSQESPGDLVALSDPPKARDQT